MRPPEAALAFVLTAAAALPGARAAIAGEVTVPAGGDQPASKPVLHLLAIGVGQQKDGFWPTLRWPATDATRIADTLGRGTGFLPDIVMLTDTQATKGAVRAALRDMERRVRAQDLVVVYVSAHGTLAEAADGDLEKVVVLHDTESGSPGKTGLRQAALLGWLDGLPARRRLAIFATCHGGVGKSRLTPEVARLVRSTKGAVAPLAAVSEGVLVLAASAKGEPAREDDRLGGDVYTHFFLEGLKVFDRNRDGMTTALEAHDYARDRTYDHSRGRQRPTAESKMIGDADLPLRGQATKPGAPVIEAYEPEWSGFAVQVDRGVKGVAPTAVSLAEGAGRVTVFRPGDGRRLATYFVAGTPGDRITLAEILAPPPFRIGLGSGAEHWRAGGFSRVAGRVETPRHAVTAEWRPAAAIVGLEHNPEREAEGSPRALLDTKVSWSSTQIYGGYGWRPAGRWSFDGLLGFGRESMKITFTDGVGDGALDYSSSALIWRAALVAAWDWREGLGVALKGEGLKGTHVFDGIGSLPADRTAWSLGVTWSFGGVARRL